MEQKYVYTLVDALAGAEDEAGEQSVPERMLKVDPKLTKKEAIMLMMAINYNHKHLLDEGYPEEVCVAVQFAAGMELGKHITEAKQMNESFN